MTCKTKTYWKISETGDLIYVGSGEDYWAHIIMYNNEFPTSAERVAFLLNQAFDLGMNAKTEQIKNTLGIT